LDNSIDIPSPEYDMESKEYSKAYLIINGTYFEKSDSQGIQEIATALLANFSTNDLKGVIEDLVKFWDLVIKERTEAQEVLHKIEPKLKEFSSSIKELI